MIVASIDIGTNTVILLIAEADLLKKSLKALHNEYRMPRIGKGLVTAKAINEEKINQLLLVLDEYSKIIKEYECEKILVTATNALRLASNSTEITDKILQLFNFNVNIISGKEEAEFAFLGALSGFNFRDSSFVIDIGGGSTELIYGNNSEIQFQKSYPIGSVIVTEEYLKHNPPLHQEIEQLENNIKKIFEGIPNNLKSDNVIAIAGTATTLACMINNLKEFDESIIDGSNIFIDQLKILIAKLKTLTPKHIISNFGNVLSGREDIILGGAFMLKDLMGIINIENVTVSSRGIRYGAIVKYLLKN